jgi:hypothetical protein
MMRLRFEQKHLSTAVAPEYRGNNGCLTRKSGNWSQKIPSHWRDNATTAVRRCVQALPLSPECTDRLLHDGWFTLSRSAIATSAFSRTGVSPETLWRFLPERHLPKRPFEILLVYRGNPKKFTDARFWAFLMRALIANHERSKAEAEVIRPL